MATWSEFLAARPEMGDVALRLLDQHHLAYLATVRADGSPRVHPVSPFVVEGRLIVATPRRSPKAQDLLRDGRYMLHLLPGSDDDECWFRGTARSIVGDEDRALVRRLGPHYVHDDDYYFDYDIEEAMTAYWVSVGKPGTYPERTFWRGKPL